MFTTVMIGLYFLCITSVAVFSASLYHDDDPGIDFIRDASGFILIASAISAIVFALVHFWSM